MKKLLLLFFTFYFLPNVYCQSPYWQQQVNYKIDVTLNDVENTLDGYVKMDYYNNSPDTLYFMWIHLWPNAYKNDRTAFADQTLENGSTDFYFSDNDKHGYINRLDFKVNGTTAKIEDHPLHQDIIKLILPQPIAPKSMAKIETPFHEKLPYSFSRGGHVGQAYQITQWYPKPAVYDSKGWHPIPYLDQGEFYSEFGNYQVQISLPKNYIVAATGELQDESEKIFLLNNAKKNLHAAYPKEKNKKTDPDDIIPSSKEIKTLHYQQNNVHDFAWFADKDFLINHDTLQLSSGRVIDVFAFYYSMNDDIWKKSISFIKRAILTKSKWLGEYPYNIVSVVDDAGKKNGGMEYPTITLLSAGSEKSLNLVINHEVGHNWFYGILASNERNHPWMDEGMNTFYDNRYVLEEYGNNTHEIKKSMPDFIEKKIPENLDHVFLQTLIQVKKDQPIETLSEKFSVANYGLVAYVKTGEWMKFLEDELGKNLFDSCMKEYYRRWQFKHPYPEDFKKVMEEVSGKNLDSTFSLLNKKGELNNHPAKKNIRLSTLFNLNETDKHYYLSFLPILGYNYYDKVMIGLGLHNYTLPLSKFRFIAVPMYATGSKQWNGIGRMSYSFFPGDNGKNLMISLSGETFSANKFTDSTGLTHNLRFFKIVPAIKFVFANNNPRSNITKYIQWKTFIINEQGLLFSRDTTTQTDIITYPTQQRYLNQFQFVIDNHRVLYPYKGIFMAEQGDGFVRTDFTGNYYFNYAKGGGMNVRLFVGKFFYLGDKTFVKQFNTDAYHLNMTGPKGYEDYTYSNYFFGRNEFDNFASQQIMMRDGGFKVRTDLLSSKIGKTDNWLAAANFTTDIPKKINPLSVLPVKIPLQIFLDVGTYAEAWQQNAATGKFIYDAGLQLSLFKNIVNIYVPLFYSKVYSDYFKSTIPNNRFVKNIAFSIDMQNISLKKFIPQIPF